MLAGAEHPAFEAASLKPSQSSQSGMILRVLRGGYLAGGHLTPQQMITVARNLQKNQMTSRIYWLSSEYFDLDARAGHAAASPNFAS